MAKNVKVVDSLEYQKSKVLRQIESQEEKQFNIQHLDQ
jgi:hypothetical protein